MKPTLFHRLTLCLAALSVAAQPVLAAGAFSYRLPLDTAPKGAEGNAVLEVDPQDLDFGNVPVSGFATRTAQVRNTGTAALVLSGLSASGPGFSLSHDCGASLSPGDACTATVTFGPAAATLHAGTFTVTSDVGQHVGSLLGEGVQGKGVASPSSVSFAGTMVGVTSAPVAVTLLNTGDAPLTVTAVDVLDGAADFGASNNCGSVLFAGGSCSVNVSFTPSVPGARSGKLVFVHNGEGGITEVSLSGTGLYAAANVSPSSLAFAATQVGEAAAAQGVTVSNAGTGPMAISEIKVTSGSADFSATHNCGATLGAGSSCTVTVGFVPTTTGPRSGTLTISGSGDNLPLSVSLTGSGQAASASLSPIAFGAVTSGQSLSMSATLANTGVGPVAVTLPAVVEGSDAFVVEGSTCPTVLAAGISCTVTVKYTASGTAAANGMLKVATSAGELSAALSGQSQQALLSVSPTSIDFGDVQVGQSKTSADITVSNSGNVSVTGLALPSATGITVTSASSGTSCTAGGTVAAGGSCKFRLVYSPTNTTALSTNVSVGSANAGSATIALTGTPKNQSGALSGGTVNGIVNVGSSANGTVTLTNNGVGPLSVTVPGAGSVTGTGFAFSSTTCSATLAAGSSCTVTFTFTPTAAQQGAVSGTFSVTTGAGTLTRTLSATAGRANLSLSSASLAFGEVNTGSTKDSTTVTVTNNGNVAATGFSVTAPSGFSIQSSTCSTTLAAGANCTFKVRFAPTAAQSYSGNVQVKHTGPNSATHNIAVTGTGKVAVTTLNLTVSSNVTNYNLFNAAKNAGWNGTSPLKVTVTVNSGVVISSNNTSTPAFDTGTGFPAGSTLTLVNKGVIVGMGGAGGSVTSCTAKGGNGQPGGPGLRAQYNITINNTGTIAGGGGGGGAGAPGDEGMMAGGGGGGGAGGHVASAGGVTKKCSNAMLDTKGTNGSSGGYNSPGKGGVGWVEDGWYDIGGNGGAGGGWGEAGKPGINAETGSPGPGQGGAAGAAVLGNSKITWTNSGTRKGNLNN